MYSYMDSKWTNIQRIFWGPSKHARNMYIPLLFNSKGVGTRLSLHELTMFPVVPCTQNGSHRGHLALVTRPRLTSHS